MISPYEFAQKQLELTAEFAQFVVDHPEVDEQLPEESYMSFLCGGSQMEIRSGDQLLALMRDYQVPCLLAAAVELDVFQALADTSLTAGQVAERVRADLRAVTILLDALASVGLLRKHDAQYSVPSELLPLVSPSHPQSVLGMLRHQANCLRRWTRLPWVVQSGAAAPREAGVRGAEADQAAFIDAMNVACRDVADDLIRQVNPGGFRCLLDIGGGPGTWTLAWLRAEPAARAILFDLPHVIPMARQRIEEAGCAARVALAPGDFYTDPLPSGADLAWVSAIIHQNSREENRALYRRVAEALGGGGQIFIRDFVMDDSRTVPAAGALFAVNMLVATPGGNTYTLSEIREDLESAGFTDVQLVRRDNGMHSVVRGRRPAG